MQPSETNYYSSLFLASRPKTLLASVLPVVLGSHLAFIQLGSINIVLLSSIILSVLCIQVATNFFNDTLDNLKGADTADRIGPKRMVSSGQIHSKSLIIAGITFVLMAVTFSLPIVVARGLPIICIGIVSLILAYCYTGGPWPLAYKGLGELFVFIFFGLTSVAGTYFVFIGNIDLKSILLGAQSGLLCCVIIAINNARDVEGDRRCGKLTLAARFGLNFARTQILCFSVLPYVIGLLWIPLGNTKMALFPFVGLPFSILISFFVFRTLPSESYNKFLGLSVIAYTKFVLLIILSHYLL